MARSWSEVLEAVKASSGRIRSYIEFNAQQKARVEELLNAQGKMTAEVDAGLDEIFDIEASDARALDAAVAAPNPPPPVEPTPVDPVPVP